jgi:hypothetical protein
MSLAAKDRDGETLLSASHDDKKRYSTGKSAQEFGQAPAHKLQRNAAAEQRLISLLHFSPSASPESSDNTNANTPGIAGSLIFYVAGSISAQIQVCAGIAAKLRLFPDIL